jgi:hypothetical protein
MSDGTPNTCIASERVIDAVANAIVEPSELHLDDVQCRAVAIAAIAAYESATPGPATVSAATCVVCKGKRDPLNPCGSCEGSGIDPVHFVSGAEIEAFLADAEIERLAQVSWEAADGYVSGVPWSAVRSSYRGEKERRRVKAVLAAQAEAGR